MLHENRRPVDEQRAAQTIHDAIQHVLDIDFGTQCPAEIDQRLPHIVPVAVKEPYPARPETGP